MLDALQLVLRAIGSILLVLGSAAALVSAVGFHRFKNFYLRLHASTIGSIWGTVYPLLGASLLALTIEELGVYKWFTAGASFVSAIVVLMLSPAGSHALSRAVHKARVARVQPCAADLLDKELCG
ncbi:MAG: monovalent cation/H(+) antiporter subunit G [Desulfurococcaceae archaeon]